MPKESEPSELPDEQGDDGGEAPAGDAPGSSPAADVAETGTALRKGERDSGLDLREGRGTTG
jgi:hypothetical protein